MAIKKKGIEYLWDTWCLASLIGIWPRFIEPHLLLTTQINLNIAHLPPDLEGLKILHCSDLHWNSNFSLSFMQRIVKKINGYKPDFIFFTGDFICRSNLENPLLLKEMLSSLKATTACFAVLGNHDYEKFVTVNEQGQYGFDQTSRSTIITKGFRRLFFSKPLTQVIPAHLKAIGYHSQLLDVLHHTPFQLLNNASKLVAFKNSWINICGLEEYMTGRFNPEQAFKEYNTQYPGIVLCHNPDAFLTLKNYPGDLLLSGHTHGGQVNLPWMWKRFTRIEQPQFKRGLIQLGKKWGYVNRGLASLMKFRWFSPPELTLITLSRNRK